MIFPKKISVCIPVCNTEKWLMQCLESVAAQDFIGIEILVLSDASRGKDENGRSAKKIVKEFSKTIKKRGLSDNISVRYLENTNNLALIESRRRLVSEAHGDYIFMLDSDDFLPPNALSSLYSEAIAHNADVVQGDCVTLDSKGKNHVESWNEVHPYEGIFEGKAVFEGCFLEGKYRPVIATKLIRKEIYLKAFSQIPFIKAHMAEEVLQYFFIARFSKLYVGIKTPVYFYRQGVGITSKKITEISEWQKVCSAASIITALYAWAKNEEKNGNPPSQEEMKSLQRLAKFYCVNNVRQLNEKVVPELHEKAREMLCDYWGEESIQNTEDFLRKTTDN
ncbi:MAG: glycosyltransferase family 2 protein [Treponema sp.]|nr:glycosyltransferase family 2 protein [Treponema sp.]